MLRSLSNKLLFIAAIQIFVAFGSNAASDFQQAFPDADNFGRRNSFSLSGALIHASADERISVDGSNRRNPISQLLPRPMPSHDPDLAINLGQTGQLPDVFSNSFVPSMKLQGGQSTTISGAPGETVVLSLKNFVLSGSAIFTLEGTATTIFVINVSKQFSLSGNAQINLVGAQWNNVFFNIRRGGAPILLSGNSSFTGTLIANGRGVQLSGNSTLNGVVQRDKLRLSGSSRVIPPPVTSP
jgi:hypothetical protein